MSAETIEISEPPETGDFAYSIRMASGPPRPVVGTQVGHFAVRTSLEWEQAVNIRGEIKPLPPWILDHVPSGISLRGFKQFAQAMVVADEVARFSEGDTSLVCTRPQDLIDLVLGADVITWVRDGAGVTSLSFREWLEKRSRIRFWLWEAKWLEKHRAELAAEVAADAEGDAEAEADEVTS